MRPTVLLVLTVAIAAADPRPGAEGTREHKKAAELVQQLGHSRFAVREAAAKQLVEMGGAAVSALTAGAKSADAEVRNRSLALLPQAKALDWKRRAEAYLADADGTQVHDLPLSAAWRKLLGRPDAGSRKLFVEMVRSNGELLEQAADSPVAGRDALKARLRMVLGQVQTSQSQSKAEVGDLAALFFVHHRLGAGERADWQGGDHPAHLLANPRLADGMADKEMGPMLRRLIVRWAEARPVDDITSHQFFALLVRSRPFPEAVPVLEKLARDSKASNINVRALAIEALGKVRNNRAKAALERLIDDRTSLVRPGDTGDMRLGDTAFAALLAAHRKRPDEYGVSTGIRVAYRFGAGGAVVALTLYAFPNDEARQKGLKKWREEK